MELLLPSLASLRPLDQSAALLLLGQGFDSTAEFLAVASQTAERVRDVVPFNTTGPGRINEGLLTILADACIGVDLGITAGSSPRPRALGIGTGAQIEQALAHLTVPSPTSQATTQVPANTVWGLGFRGGSTTKLVAIIRKQTSQPPSEYTGEYYGLPIIVVEIDPRRDWWRLITRGLAQAMAGLTDEFDRHGQDFERPPVAVLDDPRNWHALGRNTITVNAKERAGLGSTTLTGLFGDHLDPAWADLAFMGIAPYRPEFGPPLAQGPFATIRLAEGAAGYRTWVLRCDEPCLLAQTPAEPGDVFSLPVNDDPVGSLDADGRDVGLCIVCRRLVERALGTGWATGDATPRHIDRQVSHWDLAAFTTREKPDKATPTEFRVEETLTKGVTWRFTATAGNDGLTISNLKLANRPDDPMVASEDVAESITFVDLAYETSTGRHPLNIADAMANTTNPPVFEKGTNASGMLRVGVRLTLHWQTQDGLTIRADMSLVCRDIGFDFDPGGIAEACKFYPELVLTWTRGTAKKTAHVRRLHGTVRMVLNNRLTGHVHGHGGMVHDSQVVMMLTDSNGSKDDADYQVSPIDLTAVALSALSGGQIPPIHLTATWEGGRILGALDRQAAVAAYASWRHGFTPPLPEWSWLFDYGRGVGIGEPELVEVVCWESIDPDHGNTRRTLHVDWPPIPDPALPATPGLTITKLPRQGAFDNVHLNADMGVDAQGRKIVAAPFCADVCLHLHVRWGSEAVTAADADQRPAFLGWSSDDNAMSHTTLGAPLVPPNQRVSFGVQRPDQSQTVLRYIGEVAQPKPGKAQVLLEQGLGFAWSYAGLTEDLRPRIAAPYLHLLWPDFPLNRKKLDDFLDGEDGTVREFFASLYTSIRFLSYGFSPLAPAPQQIPVDYFEDTASVDDPAFIGLVKL